MAFADGLVISGSDAGTIVSQNRIDLELALVDQALTAQKPVLGICHGMQILGQFLGGEIDFRNGDLLQKVTPHIPFETPDKIAHDITIEDGTLLSNLAGGSTGEVNSFHRHSLSSCGDYVVSARAPDGIVEAIENLGLGLCIGVQWHPEFQLTDLDQKIFEEFVGVSKISALSGSVAKFSRG
jgi:gamma-glutamyl-gamma-aminobutyrate hydrolase PuuD